MFADNLKRLRNTRGLTQVEFAKIFNISAGTIAMWETEKRVPDISMIKKIADYFRVPADSLINENIKLDFVPHELDENDCTIKCPICDYEYTHFVRTRLIDFESTKSYGIALEFYCECGHTFYLVIESYKGNTFMVITDESCKIIHSVDCAYENAPIPLAEIGNLYGFNNNKYRTLDEYGKQAVDSILNIEYDRCTYIEPLADEEEDYIKLSYSMLKASAGVGDWLDEEQFTKIKVKDTPEARKADMVIEVDGHSMEPDYCDGDKVLVRLQPNIYVGEIGIFILNGMGYIKKLGENELISVNPDYDNVPLDEYNECRCVGKVVGIAEEVSE